MKRKFIVAMNDARCDTYRKRGRASEGIKPLVTMLCGKRIWGLRFQVKEPPSDKAAMRETTSDQHGLHLGFATAWRRSRSGAYIAAIPPRRRRAEQMPDIGNGQRPSPVTRRWPRMAKPCGYNLCQQASKESAHSPSRPKSDAPTAPPMAAPTAAESNGSPITEPTSHSPATAPKEIPATISTPSLIKGSSIKWLRRSGSIPTGLRMFGVLDDCDAKTIREVSLRSVRSRHWRQRRVSRLPDKNSCMIAQGKESLMCQRRLAISVKGGLNEFACGLVEWSPPGVWPINQDFAGVAEKYHFSDAAAVAGADAKWAGKRDVVGHVDITRCKSIRFRSGRHATWCSRMGSWQSEYVRVAVAEEYSNFPCRRDERFASEDRVAAALHGSQTCTHGFASASAFGCWPLVEKHSRRFRRGANHAVAVETAGLDDHRPAKFVHRRCSNLVADSLNNDPGPAWLTARYDSRLHGFVAAKLSTLQRKVSHEQITE